MRPCNTKDINVHNVNRIILFSILFLCLLNCSPEEISDDSVNLIITNDGNGTTDPVGTISVIIDTEIDISATPFEGYHFLNWTITEGAIEFVTILDENIPDTKVILYSEDTTIQANFHIEESLTIASSLHGNVYASKTGLVNHGEAIDITATPDSGYYFVNWITSAGTGVSFDDLSAQDTTVCLTGGPATIKAIFNINPITETTGTVNFNLRFVSSGNYYVGENPPGIDNCNLTKSFWVAETETTYELWYEVRYWAENTASPLYTFANDGREGNDGVDGAIPSLAQNEPVTNINWRDCIAWCNALSEKSGLTAVYYSDSGFTAPIRSVSDISSFDETLGSEDNPYVQWNANGYRLPTEAEWESTARGGLLSKETGTYSAYIAGNTGDYQYIYVDQYLWYSQISNNSTHNVGEKTSNHLGLFDMSGNVFEWCWDFLGGSYPSESIDPIGGSATYSHIRRGGSYDFDITTCTVNYRNFIEVFTEWENTGFRFLRLD